MHKHIPHHARRFVCGLAFLTSILPALAQTAADRIRLAEEIKGDSRITLATVHVSGVTDNAFAKNTINDTAVGLQASLSSYQNAPGGTVWLDPRMLAGLNQMARYYGYNFSVSETCGASHSVGSRHYSGVAYDVNIINGVHVSSSNAYYQTFMTRNRAMGATEVLGPGDAGHSDHLHLAWTANSNNVAPFSASQITASANTATGLPKYAGDGVISSTYYWAADGLGQWIQFDMGVTKLLRYVRIAWAAGNARRETFSVQVATSSSGPWTTMLDHVQSSGTTLGLESWDFADVNARYIRVVGYGNTVNTFNSMTEFVARADPITTGIKQTFAASQVTASANTAAGLPVYAADGIISSSYYWAADGSGQWIQFDMGAAKTLGYVKIAWAAGDARRETFSVQVASASGGPWTTVLDHVQSSGTTLGFETWDFADVSARYVRVVGYGNTVNTFNSMTEFEAWVMP
ncbi:MAG: discoidin domain-containing protein [Opitutae bacterium]|nr:discoidin domain-containing protein [Opitutae bacterium]